MVTTIVGIFGRALAGSIHYSVVTGWEKPGFTRQVLGLRYTFIFEALCSHYVLTPNSLLD